MGSSGAGDQDGKVAMEGCAKWMASKTIKKTRQGSSAKRSVNKQRDYAKGWLCKKTYAMC